ncbi:MAG: hypothetical protein KBC16_00555 [Candidatus Pacebacteria bacterium]|nr:hypothetical protein [Candidatus Paceibacterota bacterium]
MRKFAKWTGDWEYRNHTDPRFSGKRGTLTVNATSSNDAEDEIKRAVSRDIIGTTSFVSFVHVTNIRKEG